MALQSGHRFPVSMADLFPYGVLATNVEQAQDFDEKTRARTPARDKQTGELVWVVTCVDRDEGEKVRAKDRNPQVTVTAPYQPVLDGEVAPGMKVYAVEFTGLTITPYINEGRGRPRLAYSIRATGMYAQGKAPADTAPPTGRSGGQAPQGDHPEGKVA